MSHDRTFRFRRLISDCHTQLPTPTACISVIRARERYSVLLRLAALRTLIALAPLEVTGGATYLTRRRRVRLHYGV